MFSPSARLLKLLGLWLALALLLLPVRILWPDSALYASWLWWALGAALLAVSVFDLSRQGFCRQLQVARTLPGSLAIGVDNKVRLRLDNRSDVPVALEVSDWAPAQIEVQGLPLALQLAPHQHADIDYQVLPTRRGDAEFEAVELRIVSRLGLWRLRRKFVCRESVKVYPNFASIAQFELLGHDQQITQLGIHTAQRRGQGMEFQQLREFRQGDVMRQVDWKASARQRKLISRQYQEERDQEIVVLLDSGRRMRARDGNLSHFDHSLNAVLLLAYVALKQGDALGFLSFGGGPAQLDRWLAPLKGADNINTLMNQVYDLHSSTAASDLLQAAQQLLERHRKRSLVVLVSNLREEDEDDLRAAVELLAKQHLVMVASLRENSVDELLKMQVTGFAEALNYSAAVDYNLRRQRLLDSLKAGGVVVTDAAPQHMHIHLVNEYLSLKRSGRL